RGAIGVSRAARRDAAKQRPVDRSEIFERFAGVGRARLAVDEMLERPLLETSQMPPRLLQVIAEPLAHRRDPPSRVPVRTRRAFRRVEPRRPISPEAAMPPRVSPI